MIPVHLEDYIHEDSLKADGFDDCIIGVTNDGKVVYDIEKMISTLVHKEDMEYEEANEYLEFNTFGAYVGDYTPIYVNVK